MIVCSCNFITSREIEEVVTGFLEIDAWRLITPGMVYHAMAKRGKCCGCFPGVIDIIIDTTTDFHRRRMTPEAKIIPFVTEIRREHERCDTIRRLRALAKPQQQVA